MRAWLSFCLLLFLPIMVVDARAQSMASADLHVIVKDSAGANVRGATVTVRDLGRNFERATRTDSDGDYAFLLLLPGEYSVTAEAPLVSVNSAITVSLGNDAARILARIVARRRAPGKPITHIDAQSQQSPKRGAALATHNVADLRTGRFLLLIVGGVPPFECKVLRLPGSKSARRTSVDHCNRSFAVVAAPEISDASFADE